MPTTYTHDIFGKAVYQKLPLEIKEIIQRNKMIYMIGLHGPDILFYYRPFQKNKVNQMGQTLHEEPASGFFRHCKNLYLKERDEAVLAYTLGFICHFMLDSTCHPYIYSYEAKTGASHAEIETELDRVLMEKNGKNPFHFKPASMLKEEWEAVHAIAKVFDDISEKQIRSCLRGMRFYTGVVVCRWGWKRGILLRLLKVLRVYEETHGRMMRRHHFFRCEESTRELMHLLRCAVPETVTVLEEFYMSLEDPEALNYRFERNYR